MTPVRPSPPRCLGTRAPTFAMYHSHHAAGGFPRAATDPRLPTSQPARRAARHPPHSLRSSAPAPASCRRGRPPRCTSPPQRGRLQGCGGRAGWVSDVRCVGAAAGSAPGRPFVPPNRPCLRNPPTGGLDAICSRPPPHPPPPRFLTPLSTAAPSAKPACPRRQGWEPQGKKPSQSTLSPRPPSHRPRAASSSAARRYRRPASAQ